MLSGDGTWAVWCPRERSRGQTCISELSSLSPLGSGRGGHHYGGWGQLLPRTPASLGGPWGGTPQPQSSPRNGVSPIHPARVQWGGQPRGTGHHARVDLAHCDQGLRKGPSRPGPPHLPAFFTKPRSASSTSHSSQRKHPGCQLLFMALMTRPMMNSPGRERSLQASTGHTPLPSAAPPKPPSALSWVILELREPMPAGGLWACPLPGPATHSGQCGCVEGGEGYCLQPYHRLHSTEQTAFGSHVRSTSGLQTANGAAEKGQADTHHSPRLAGLCGLGPALWRLDKHFV